MSVASIADPHECRQDPVRRRAFLEEAATRGGDDAIELLVAGFYDENAGVRQAAVDGLLRIGSSAVMSKLLSLLREPPSVRNMAVEIIEHILPNALDPALHLLTSPDPNVRKLLIDAFGKSPDTRVIPALRQSLRDPDANIRAAAAEALGRLRARGAVAEIINLLGDAEWVACSALKALADIGDASALPAVAALLSDSTEPMRDAAIEALAHLDTDGSSVPALIALAPSLLPDQYGVFITTFIALASRRSHDLWHTLDRSLWLSIFKEGLINPNPEVQLAAMTGLGLLGDDRAGPWILNICLTWNNPGENAIAIAADALASTARQRQLVDALVRVEQPDTFYAILIQAIGKQGDPGAVPALTAIRRYHSNWELRRAALNALRAIGTPAAWAAIHEAIDDQTGYVRCEAIKQIAASGRNEDLWNLLTKLRQERYEDVRQELVLALAQDATQEIGIEAVALLDDPRPETRRAAAELIGAMKLPEGFTSLLHALDDAEWPVREAAAQALGRYDDRRATEAVKMALADDHERVRLAAVMALAEQNHPDGWAALIAHALSDSDMWVRYRTIERLGHARRTEAIAALTDFQHDGRIPEMIRRAAQDALQMMQAAPPTPERSATPWN